MYTAEQHKIARKYLTEIGERMSESQYTDREKVVTLALMRYRLRKLHKQQNNFDKKFKEDFDKAIFNSLPVPPTTSVKKARGGRRKKRKSKKQHSKKHHNVRRRHTRRKGSGPKERTLGQIQPELKNNIGKIVPIDNSGKRIRKEIEDTQPLNLPAKTTPPPTPRDDVLDMPSPLHKRSFKRSLPRPWGGMHKRHVTRRKR